MTNRKQLVVFDSFVIEILHNQNLSKNPFLVRTYTYEGGNNEFRSDAQEISRLIHGMKYLDTYESWGQTFKIIRLDNDHFNIWIHQNDNAHKLQIQKHEIQDLINFLQNFIDEDSNDKNVN